MKFIKTIETLYQKAQETGFARINGRMSFGYGGLVGDIEEKYAIKIEDEELTMRHWSTVTIKVNLNTKEIIEYYGESNSDRDSLNTLVYLLGIEPNFRYLPSRNLFIYEN